MKTYFLIEIHHNKKNTEVNKIINELIDNSLFFEVEILFQLFKKEQYHNKKILLRLSIIWLSLHKGTKSDKRFKSSLIL